MSCSVPPAINDGYAPPSLTRLLRFNGMEVRNMSQLTEMVESSTSDWFRFEVSKNALRSR
jgi:hypothetical protein